MCPNKKWQDPDIKRFEIGRMGDKKMEFLLAGLLVVIIVVSLFLSLGKFFWSGDGRTLDSSVHLACLVCDYEFEISHEEADKITKDLGRYGGPSGMMAMMSSTRGPFTDCRNPECGKKMSAWVALQCLNPECKKYYVSDLRVAAYKSLQAGRQPKDFPDKCTYCGKDQQQLREQRAQEREK